MSLDKSHSDNRIQSLALRWRRRLEVFFPSKRITVEQARRLKKQMHDFSRGGRALFWQRQGIYAGAAILCGFYYSIPIAVLCYVLCQLTDLFDSFISLRFINRKDHSFRHSIVLLKWLFLSNTLSTLAVAIFTYLIAKLEGPTEHFSSLFFLFAAGLFAAVNNHQLPQVLAVRLIVYGALFIYIPGADIWNQHTSY